ncbi:MAG: glycosyltransferase family 4 protein [Sedimentibacter sp.]|uniref:glycosyltransferase family 4 protein n=1 Tax=Sedimentibacter sp. TaxID=1960295 RepID=UPI00298271CB|nr:glycosyltransferase family 4 protein [Sedimentibacter sp.]MDW5298976.1 glycosyltransferase family 4 protein [Sedimentibacter sp.]
MNILFIAPRFHTNQFLIVKGLLKNGHKVNFFVQSFGATEDHSLVSPILMQESFVSKFINRIIKCINNGNINKDSNLSILFFFPSFIWLYKNIKDFKPDVVVFRNRNLTTLVGNIICKVLKIKARILYNQTELYSGNNKRTDIKEYFLSIIKTFLFPSVRITPVLFSDFKNKNKNKRISPQDYFVPFINEVDESALNRKYFKSDKINILDVGKYRDYKNHFLLVDAIKHLRNPQNLKVTIIGQISSEQEENYFSNLQEYIKSKKLEQVIHLRKNVEFKCMSNIYRENDIFILTSKKEVASISILESMANGLVTISTDSNGTASYILEGVNGYIFKTMDSISLSSIINKLISNQSLIERMGRKGMDVIMNSYSFDEFYSAFNNVLETEFELSLVSEVNDEE